MKGEHYYRLQPNDLPHSDGRPVRQSHRGVIGLTAKGYLNLVVSFYNYITGDATYDEPFKVQYDANTVYTYDHRSLNELIAKHNRYYPIEANLPMELRTGRLIERGVPWRPMPAVTAADLLARAR